MKIKHAIMELNDILWILFVCFFISYQQSINILVLYKLSDNQDASLKVIGYISILLWVLIISTLIKMYHMACIKEKT